MKSASRFPPSAPSSTPSPDLQPPFPMRLSMIVNPFTERNLQLAAQVGVEEIVLTYPGPGLAPLQNARRMVEAAGMRLTHLERKIPHLKFVHHLPGRDAQIEDFKTLIRQTAEAGMEVL